MSVLVVGVVLMAFGLWSYRQWRGAERHYKTRDAVPATDAVESTNRDSPRVGQPPPDRGRVTDEVMMLPARSLGYASPIAIALGAICIVVGLVKVLG